jgi:hypothetical protein
LNLELSSLETPPSGGVTELLIDDSGERTPYDSTLIGAPLDNPEPQTRATESAATIAPRSANTGVSIDTTEVRGTDRVIAVTATATSS